MAFEILMIMMRITEIEKHVGRLGDMDVQGEWGKALTEDMGACRFWQAVLEGRRRWRNGAVRRVTGEEMEVLRDFLATPIGGEN